MTDDVYNARKNENFDNFCKLLIKITEDYQRLDLPTKDEEPSSVDFLDELRRLNIAMSLVT